MVLSARALVLSASLLGAGCALQTSERRMVPDTAPSVQQQVGYSDVIRLSQDYAVAHGYEVMAVSQAEEVRPNYWRVRFGLGPKGSGKLLDLEFDEMQRRVVGTTELEDTATGGSGGTLSPIP